MGSDERSPAPRGGYTKNPAGRLDRTANDARSTLDGDDGDQRPMPPLMPGIWPSQSAGRLHGMEVSRLGVVQPVVRATKTIRSKPSTVFLGEVMERGLIPLNRRTARRHTSFGGDEMERKA